MSGRRAAIKRLLLIIPMILYTYAIAILFYLLFIPYFIIDILYQLIAGGDGLPTNTFIQDTHTWFFENQAYLLFGDGDWAWFP
jgi:hypothetical protein